MEQEKLKFEREAAMNIAEKAMTPPIGETASTTKEESSSEEKSFGGKVIDSFKEHPFLWGLGAGAVLAGGGAIALYSGLPLMGK